MAFRDSHLKKRINWLPTIWGTSTAHSVKWMSIVLKWCTTALIPRWSLKTLTSGNTYLRKTNEEERTPTQFIRTMKFLKISRKDLTLDKTPIHMLITQEKCGISSMMPVGSWESNTSMKPNSRPTESVTRLRLNADYMEENLGSIGRISSKQVIPTGMRYHLKSSRIPSKKVISRKKSMTIKGRNRIMK